MPVLTGSMVAGPNRATFMNTIFHDAVLAQGWEFVKEWMVGSATHRTYRCPAANTGGAEFYVTVGRTTGTTTIYFTLHGKFDAATNTLDHLPFYSQNGQQVTVRADGTQNLTLTNPLGNGYAYSGVTIGDSATSYFLKAKPTYLVIGSGAINNTVYLGAYDAWNPVPAGVASAAMIQLASGTAGGVIHQPVGANTFPKTEAGLTTAYIPNYSTPNPDVDYGSGRLPLLDVFLRSMTGGLSATMFGRLHECAMSFWTGSAFLDTITSPDGEYVLTHPGHGVAIKRT